MNKSTLPDSITGTFTTAFWSSQFVSESQPGSMGLLYEAKVGEGKLMVSSMGLDQLQNQYPEARTLRNSILTYMNSDKFDPQFEVDVETVKESVIGTEKDPRVNVAEKSNGGDIRLGENTITCQIGYDNNPQDRKPSQTTGFVKGDNYITFDPVTTSQIRITMVHQEGMGVALSEFIVYEKSIPAETIKIVPKDNRTSVKAGETLVLSPNFSQQGT